MLRRRLRELEARVEALEALVPIDYAMPPRPDLGTTPVEAQLLWRERCDDYGQILMYDVPDDRSRVYI